MNAIIALEPVLKEWRNIPFSWDAQNCVLFTTRCIDAQRGTNYTLQVSERYPCTNYRQGYRMMLRGGGLEALTTGYLGYPTNWAMLQNGDVVLGRAADRDVQVLGVLYNQAFLTTGLRGIVSMPMDYAIKGWRLCR